MTDNLSAEDRIRKVRISFLRENPFFANISLYLNLIEARNMPMPTMGIDYEGNLYFDPDYVKSLTFSELKGVIAHETCLVPETFVWNKKISEIKTGDKILGDDGREHGVILTNERKYEGELICITPRGSLPIKITPNHPILTTKGSWKGFQKPNYRKLKNRVGENKFIFDKFEWKKAEDITLYDWLVIPKIKPLGKYENYIIKFQFGNAWSITLKKSIKEGLKLDEDIAYFLGLYTADGCANLNSHNISIFLHSEKDIEKIERVKRIIENKMGFKVKIKKRDNCKCIDVKFTSMPFIRFLHKNIGTRAGNKKIPEFILFNNNEIKKAYLKGFIDGDGYNNHINIGFATISENLAHQLFMLSASLGIIFNMYKQRRNAKKALSHLNKINKEWTDIYIFFSRCHKIYDVLNLPHEERTIRKTKFFKEYNDFILVRVRKIQKEKYNGMVYNLQTENQNYTANNIIVHNCHIVLQHLLRKGSRDKVLWNCSADLAINLILQEQEFRLPSGVLMDDDFKDLCAEEIYDKLYRTAKKIKVHIDGQGNVTIGNMSGKQFDKHFYPKKGENGDGGSGGKDKDYKGKGEEDSPLSEREIKKLEDEWKKRIVEATTLARTMGKMPAGLERMIGTLLEPKINWKALLYRYVTNEIISDMSYSFPHKKSESIGIYFPHTVKENVEIAVAIDSSGSIDETTTNEFISEIVGISRSFANLNMTLLVCDAKVHDVYEIRNGFDPKDIKIRGFGGTDFKPVFSYIEENKPYTKLLIYLTDLCGDFPKSTNIKTLWVVKGGYDKVPFGEVIKYGE